MRVNTGIINKAIAMIVVVAPEPRIAANKIADRTGGNANNTSIIRIVIASKRPRLQAAVTPIIVPVTPPIAIAENAIPSETQAPAMIIDNASRPK